MWSLIETTRKGCQSPGPRAPRSRSSAPEIIFVAKTGKKGPSRKLILYRGFATVMRSRGQEDSNPRPPA